jgi:gamma-glutamylputrescine oxidase
VTVSGEAHAPSYYAATARGLINFPSLESDARADVCIIGGGYTGLSAALHLSERGYSVVLIEANKVGWGASGRNGGQLHSAQRREQSTLEKWFGKKHAHQLFDLGEEAKALVKGLIKKHEIDCDWQEGLIHAIHKPRYLNDMAREIDLLHHDYGVSDVSTLSRDEIAAALGTNVYFGGWREQSAGHLHPLNYALGLARAAHFAGARIYENTAALSVSTMGTPRVTTQKGIISADHIILAGNGYLHGIDDDTESRVMPLHNFILTTEPLGARGEALIPKREAAADSRFVVYYWRLTKDNRLLFGGGETYGQAFPKDIKAFVRPHMLKLYPQLADVKIDYAWGGTLAVTMKRLPYLRRLRPGLYTACGYSGQGVGTATFAGKLLAEAIAGESERFDVFSKLPAPPFPGGRMFRTPTLALAMTWYALRDRL